MHTDKETFVELVFEESVDSFVSIIDCARPAVAVVDSKESQGMGHRFVVGDFEGGHHPHLILVGGSHSLLRVFTNRSHTGFETPDHGHLGFGRRDRCGFLFGTLLGPMLSAPFSALVEFVASVGTELDGRARPRQ